MSVNVAVAQVQAPGPADLDALFASWRQQALEAQQAGAVLVVFPACTGLVIMDCLAASSWSWPGDVPQLVDAFGQQADEQLLGWAAGLAGDLQLDVVAGSTLLAGREGLYHRAALFSGQGKLVLSQDQTHRLANSDAPWRLHPSDSLDIVERPYGSVGLVLADDIRVPEVPRILSLQGADLLVSLQAQPGPHQRWQRLAGAWQEVQQNQVFCLEACLVGRLGGSGFGQPSAILAPCELSAGGDGVLAAATSVNQQLLVSSLDPGALHQLREDYPLRQHLNPGLYQHSLLPAYARLAGREQ